MLTIATADVTVATILLQTDAVDLALARDDFGGTFLCSLVDVSRSGHQYLAIQISDDRLAELRRGDKDLRTILKEPEHGLYFSGAVTANSPVRNGRPVIQLKAVPEVDESWFPDPGFLLSNFSEEIPTDELVKDAMSRNAAVIACRLNPPEALGRDPKINCDRLAEWLNLMQSLVKQASKKAMKGVSKTRKGQFGNDPYVLQVTGFSPGSFTVHLASQEGADLLGLTATGAGMKKVDELMSLTSADPDVAFQKLSKNTGAILQAFENVMEFISKEKTPVEYRWAEPGMPSSNGTRVTTARASSMVGVLKTTSLQKTDPLRFTGRVTSVNTDKQPFTWRAVETESGRKRHGRVHQLAGSVLNGVIIRDVVYSFDCEVRLEKPVSGKTISVVYLKDIEKT